jgi:post-segregation antitoxin (ccd killing protein)
MLMLTTAAMDVDEELLNRCLVLSVNESREQTAAIHARQRCQQTLGGLLQSAGREAIHTLHHNAQRLLSGVAVVNPYADRLTFFSDKTRTRRDHMKYLTLIRAIALLHQHQRPVLTVEHAGQTLSYIEASPCDIALANKLTHHVLGRTLDELPPQTHRLLVLLRTWVQGQCAARGLRQSDLRFSRKQLRDACHWGDTQLKVHLSRLVELEHVFLHRKGVQCEYELVYDGAHQNEAGAHVNGLFDVARLQETSPTHAYDKTWPGLDAVQAGSGRPLVGALSGVCQGGVTEAQTRVPIGLQGDAPVQRAKTHCPGPSSIAASPVVGMAAAQEH